MGPGAAKRVASALGLAGGGLGGRAAAGLLAAAIAAGSAGAILGQQFSGPSRNGLGRTGQASTEANAAGGPLSPGSLSPLLLTAFGQASELERTSAGGAWPKPTSAIRQETPAQATNVPEPTTLSLMAAGLVALLTARRIVRRSAAG